MPESRLFDGFAPQGLENHMSEKSPAVRLARARMEEIAPPLSRSVYRFHRSHVWSG
jgi:hypothetical protein